MIQRAQYMLGQLLRTAARHSVALDGLSRAGHLCDLLQPLSRVVITNNHTYLLYTALVYHQALCGSTSWLSDIYSWGNTDSTFKRVYATVWSVRPIAFRLFGARCWELERLLISGPDAFFTPVKKQEPEQHFWMMATMEIRSN